MFGIKIAFMSEKDNLFTRRRYLYTMNREENEK